jgi:tape measure domain-containing protein
MNSANGGDVLFHFKGDTSNLDKSIKNTSNGMTGMTKSILAATGVTKLLSTGMNMITGSTDNAIKRIDTFNAFPKVLQNFGVSADEAKKSMDRIDQSVRGLPTSLDQAVAGVQNIFMVTKDLPKAEAMFKAINDSAMVFANGSTEAVDRFTYAYKQAMSSGKVYAQDFNQMNEAIPGLMDKVAESMGVSFAELKTGLSDGSISIDQFNETLQKLDTEGTSSMQALGEVAKTSTGGIATQITNAKTAITRGVAEMIKSIDEGLANAGLGGIGEVVTNIAKSIESGLKTLAPYIVSTIGFLVTYLPPVINTLKTIAPVLIPIIAAFTTYSTVIKTVAAVQGILNAVMMANPIGLLIALIVGLIATVVLLWNKCEWFRNAVKVIFDALKTGFLFFVNLIKLNIEAIKIVFTFLVNHIKSRIELIRAVIQTIINFGKNAVNWIKGVPNTIISFFRNLPNNMLNIGKNIMHGLWNGIQGLKNWVINKVKGIGKAILSGIKGVLGIHSPSTEFAMIGKFSVLGYTEQLDKMRGDIQEAMYDNFALDPQLVNSSALHYSPNIVNNTVVNVDTDPLGQTVNKIKTFSGGAKNDYNWGASI